MLSYLELNYIVTQTFISKPLLKTLNNLNFQSQL